MDARRFVEEDDELNIDFDATGHCCAMCGESISFAEEVFVLTVSCPTVTQEGLEYAPILLEDGSDFAYEPYFFCFHCWENLMEDVREEKRDQPPILDTFAVLECEVCHSGIRQHEVLGLGTFGELHLSKRDENPDTNTTFAEMDSSPSTLCISCLNKLNEQIDELWEDGVKHFYECESGCHMRCWKFGCSGEDGSAECEQMKEIG